MGPVCIKRDRIRFIYVYIGDEDSFLLLTQVGTSKVLQDVDTG